MSSRTRNQKDYQTILSDLLGTGALYADPDFPPVSTSMYFDGRIPSRLGRIVWKRPQDLYKNPQFMVKGARRHDLDQGYLGDCWFVAAAACLATGHKKLFEKVVPPDQDFDRNYAGVFRFNFWWYGKWKEVVVDDYLPTNGQQLVYCSNKERPNEFWPALLEKAYAKLRGCYESLHGGKFQDAMVDMTGGISEVIDLRERDKLPPDLYDLMMRGFQMKSLMGCCIFRPKGSTQSEVEMANGLYMGHAYSITAFQQLESTQGVVRLIRMRNPWGRGEWKGPWSDNSKEMARLPDNIREKMNIRNKDEGEFWISFEDFLRNFDEVQLCHLQVDAMIEELEDNKTKQNWNVTVYHDEWIRGVTAGGCGNPPDQLLYWNNPQFVVELKKPDDINSRGGDCTLIISLMEKEEKDPGKVAIGFDVYKLKNPNRRPLNETRAPQNALLLARRSGTYMPYREVTRRFEMPPGCYVVIPSTFKPHNEARFMLRIFTEKFAESSVMEENDDTPERGDVPPVLSPKDFVSDIFRKHCGPDSRLDPSELQKFLADVSEEDVRHRMNFNIEQCRSLLPMVDENRSGRLEFQEAKKLWKETKAYREVFLQFDKDRSNSVDTYELSTLFSKLGGRFLLLLRDSTVIGPDGFPVTRPVLTSIVRRYGDRNNRISLEDFVVVIMRLINSSVSTGPHTTFMFFILFSLSFSSCSLSMMF
ncbi:calpain-9-like [Babylonia areolata]|uniref:calpain-9-like n=1 Tax=Babylonia areolata TaxID=304850 RepID=UPI003FD36CE7